MANTGLQIGTPIGELHFAIEVFGEHQAEPSLEDFAFQPILPLGMSVATCCAVVLHLPGDEADMRVRFTATLVPTVSVDSGAETGQGLEAQSWRSENHVLLLGTEDAEFLEARLPNQMRISDGSFTYGPNSFSMEFARNESSLPIEIHFLTAWNELPEPKECSCWYAVDQSHATVMGAPRAHISLGTDTPQNAVLRRPPGAKQL